MTGDPSYARPGDDRPSAGGPPSAAADGYPAGDAYPANDAYPPRDETGPAPAPPTSGTPGTSPSAQTSIDRTRTSALWVAAIAAAVVILMLLIFILQNGQQVEVALFGANPNLPLGVALLLAAVLGALIVALLGTARVVQLRHVAKRRGKAAKTTRR